MLKPLYKIRQGNLERHCDVFQHGTRSAKCRIFRVVESRAGSKYLLTLKALVFKLDLGEVPMKPVRIAVLLSAGLALGAITASAQPVIGAKSGVVNVAEGKVYLADRVLGEGANNPKDPFNTHSVPGFPPQAISNPGEDALKAALHPNNKYRGYGYFQTVCADNHMVYSKTHAEFIAAQKNC